MCIDLIKFTIVFFAQLLKEYEDEHQLQLADLDHLYEVRRLEVTASRRSLMSSSSSIRSDDGEYDTYL